MSPSEWNTFSTTTNWVLTRGSGPNPLTVPFAVRRGSPAGASWCSRENVDHRAANGAVGRRGWYYWLVPAARTKRPGQRARQALRRRRQWPAIWPPSMCKISPVIKADDSRKRMPSTMSLTCPTRPSGWRLADAS
jgi:hypothetical protein